jgi:DNA-directed RNA polymerase subunit RPC12/RpoP
MMAHYTCFKCGRHIELDPVLVGMELSKLKKKNPKYYQAQCPACQVTNKVALNQIQSDLDAAADEIAVKVAEMEKAREAAKSAKKAAIAEKRAEAAGKK